MRLQSLQHARDLLSAATNPLTQWSLGEIEVESVRLSQVPETEAFPTMAEVERAMILAAYRRSNRKPLEAARLLGIGKTTLYRKLREIGDAAA